MTVSALSVLIDVLMAGLLLIGFVNQSWLSPRLGVGIFYVMVFGSPMLVACQIFAIVMTFKCHAGVWAKTFMYLINSQAVIIAIWFYAMLSFIAHFRHGLAK